MSEWQLSDDELDEILKLRVLPAVFPGATQGGAKPTLVLVAGQPGSGRARTSRQLITEHGGELAFVSGDDLRAFHPRSVELSRTQTSGAMEALATATARWVRECIRFAREHKRSVVLEGAFQDPGVAIGTAERFAGEGFQTRIVVAASRRAESLLSVASLYLRGVHASAPARFVSSAAHDRAREATRTLVAAAEDAASIDRLTIVSRNGETAFDAHRADGDDALRGVSAALEDTQSARLSRFDATQWLSELRHITEFAASRRDLPRGMTDLLVDLHQIALREVIPELHVPSGGSFRLAIEQKTVARLVDLRRSIQREQMVDAAAPVVTPVGPERGGISR